MITPLTALGLGVAFLVGGVLGVLGAGGAILAVPALVYLFEIPARESTHLSLGIVGLVALFGIVQSWRSGEVDLGWTIRFFMPSSLGVLLARKWLVPAIPKELDFVLMLAFAALMIFAARAMLRKGAGSSPEKRVSMLQFGARSFAVGGVTGLLGAGGGFLIVPILSLWAGLSFRVAAATSLAVIFLNSALGFVSGWSPEAAARLPVLFAFVGVAAIGLLLSRRMARDFYPDKLRRGFGVFLIIVAAITLLQEALARL
jgi:uncharacterized membrane protein YfcA